MNEEVTLLSATDDELLAEVKRRGYQIYKKPERIRFLPCVCGHNRRMEWFLVSGGYKFTCRKCGLTSPGGGTEKAARIEWNNMIEMKRKEMEA